MSRSMTLQLSSQPIQIQSHEIFSKDFLPDWLIRLDQVETHLTTNWSVYVYYWTLLHQWVQYNKYMQSLKCFVCLPQSMILTVVGPELQDFSGIYPYTKNEAWNTRFKVLCMSNSIYDSKSMQGLELLKFSGIYPYTKNEARNTQEFPAFFKGNPRIFYEVSAIFGRSSCLAIPDTLTAKVFNPVSSKEILGIFQIILRIPRYSQPQFGPRGLYKSAIWWHFQQAL